jgi:hypothetical protein
MMNVIVFWKFVRQWAATNVGFLSYGFCGGKCFFQQTIDNDAGIAIFPCNISGTLDLSGNFRFADYLRFNTTSHAKGTAHGITCTQLKQRATVVASKPVRYLCWLVGEAVYFGTITGGDNGGFLYILFGTQLAELVSHRFGGNAEHLTHCL